MDGLQPQEIIDQAIPLLTGNFLLSSGTVSNPVIIDSGAAIPTSQVDKKFPPVVIAQETISQSLNTETKAITGPYTFEQRGAFAISSLIHPLANIKISGDGIVATDANGATTFSLDGETGAAVFKGTVEAADFTVVDETGIISLANFVTAEVSAGAVFTTASAAYVDITNITINTDSLPRIANVLIFADGTLFGTGTIAGDSQGEIKVGITVNNAVKAEISFRTKSVGGDSNGDLTTLSSHQFMQLPAGVSTLKLQMKATPLGVGNFTANGLNFRLTYVILGR